MQMTLDGQHLQMEVTNTEGVSDTAPKESCGWIVCPTPEPMGPHDALD